MHGELSNFSKNSLSRHQREESNKGGGGGGAAFDVVH